MSGRVEGKLDTCHRLVTQGKALAELMSEGAKFRCSGGATETPVVRGGNSRGLLDLDLAGSRKRRLHGMNNCGKRSSRAEYKRHPSIETFE
ncbi:MAG: hypothetical protein JWO91_1104 [Acidobacteriaceae bacterium]|nr:hypothetical protein [Acidobacteriaceae bacterium]